MIRDQLIVARLTGVERDAVFAEAKALGVSVSEFVRRACAAEVDILRQQRAIREEQRRLRLMPNGTTSGNVAMSPIEVRYVD